MEKRLQRARVEAGGGDVAENREVMKHRQQDWGLVEAGVQSPVWHQICLVLPFQALLILPALGLEPESPVSGEQESGVCKMNSPPSKALELVGSGSLCSDLKSQEAVNLFMVDKAPPWEPRLQ